MDHLNKNKKPSGGHGGGYSECLDARCRPQSLTACTSDPYGAQGGSSGGGLGSFFGGGKVSLRS
jgi:hypothetical protein